MFRRILLPLDLTDHHQRAIEIATELARPSAGVITLLHVIETIAGLSKEEEKDFYDRLERAARRHLDGWGKDLEQRGVPWQAAVRYGNRAAECVRYAQEAAADLILLTAPPLDLANLGAGLGSTSYKIGLLAQCPVLLVK